jgi:hypothetical protein
MELSNGKDQIIQELGRRLEEVQRQPTESEKPLGTKERDSLLKLVIGMAIGGYRYDPKAKRSE